MKKTLSLILALVMALSLSVPAFAGSKTTISEVNLTVGKTYTDLDTGVSVSVPDEADYTASYGGMEFVVGSDVYFYQITGGDSNLWLNMKSYTPCGTAPDVSNADKVFAVINVYTTNWQTYEFAENAGLTVTCNGRTINQKAQAASKEGWFLVGGLSPQVHIDITPPKTSGSTTITATKAEPFSYEIVIPTDVAEITAAGVYQVGQAKVTNVISATDSTVISYTATTTDFKHSTDNSKTMAATYHTEKTAENAFPTDAVTVYENNADAASIPTMWVKIADSDWNAAEAGTYHATVTFNFSAEEVEAPAAVTAADALTTEAKYNLKLDYNQSDLRSYSITYKKTEAGFEVEKILENDSDVTGTYSTGLSSEVSGTTIIFKFGDNITFTLDTSTNIYNFTGKGAVYTTFTSFSVKPAGATKFTEISLTKAE